MDPNNFTNNNYNPTNGKLLINNRMPGSGGNDETLTTQIANFSRLIQQALSQVPSVPNLLPPPISQMAPYSPSIGISNLQSSSVGLLPQVHNSNQSYLNPLISYQYGSLMGLNPQVVGADTTTNQISVGNGPSNARDSSWLKLAICPKFLAGICLQSRDNCEFAHPEPNIQVENGIVTVCYDYMKKGECKHPRCKYFHVSEKQKSIVERQGGNARPNGTYATAISPVPTVVQPLRIGPGYTPAQITPEDILREMRNQQEVQRTAQFQQAALVHLRNLSTAQSLQGSISAPNIGNFNPPLYLSTTGMYSVPQITAGSALSPGYGAKRPAPDNGFELVAQPAKRSCSESAHPAISHQSMSSGTALALHASQQFGGNYYANSTNAFLLASGNGTNGTSSTLTRCALFSSDGKPLDSVEVCRDFLAGRCLRSINCNYLHVENGSKLEVVNNKVQICRDALTNQCKYENCRYYHIPIEILVKRLPACGLANNKPPETETAENAPVDRNSAPKVTTPTYSSAENGEEFQFQPSSSTECGSA